MRVFVLGGTGSIGSPILRELRKRGHEVWALARSDVSATKLLFPELVYSTVEEWRIWRCG